MKLFRNQNESETIIGDLRRDESKSKLFAVNSAAIRTVSTGKAKWR